MAKRFDAELNVLTAAHPEDWGAYLCPRVGVPLGPLVELDTDLATTRQADRLWRVDGPVPAVLHVEFESRSALGRPVRVYKYNADVYAGLPVHSVIMLLRPSANSSDLTGELVLPDAAGRPYVTFRYHVVRLWQEPMAGLLAIGPGVAPLAVLTDEATADVGGTFDRVQEHLQAAGLTDTLVLELVTSGLVLAGLRYEEEEIGRIQRRLSMSFSIEDSSTYRMIRREGERLGEARGETRGEARGALKKAQRTLERLGAKQFGPPPADVETELRAITDEGRLDRMMDRLDAAADWADLLTTP